MFWQVKHEHGIWYKRFPVQLIFVYKMPKVFSYSPMTPIQDSIRSRVVRRGVAFFIFNSLHTSANTRLRNSVPWTLTNMLGIPWRHIHDVTKWYVTVFASWLYRGAVMENFVRSSCIVRMYAFFLSVLDRGPTTSMKTFAKGSITVVLMTIGCFCVLITSFVYLA